VTGDAMTKIEKVQLHTTSYVGSIWILNWGRGKRYEFIRLLSLLCVK